MPKVEPFLDRARVFLAALRYGAGPIRCRVVESAGGLELELNEPAHAVAPGQLACLMTGDVVTGFGTIAGAA